MKNAEKGPKPCYGYPKLIKIALTPSDRAPRHFQLREPDRLLVRAELDAALAVFGGVENEGGHGVRKISGLKGVTFSVPNHAVSVLRAAGVSACVKSRARFFFGREHAT